VSYDSFVRDRLPPENELPEFLPLDYPARLNAAAELLEGGKPGDLAIVNAHGRWTYADLDDFSGRVARLLVEEKGLIPGNRVLLRGPNGYTMFAAWLGVLKAGGVVVTTMPLLRPGEIATVIDSAEISHAIVDSRFIGDFRGAMSQTRFVKHLVKYDGDYGKGELEMRCASLKPLDPVGHRPRRPGDGRVHQRHYRHPQGLHPVSPRHPRAVRHFRQKSFPNGAGRYCHDQRADRLHLRARRDPDVPAFLRRRHRNDRAALAADDARGDGQIRRHPPRDCPDRLQGHAVTAWPGRRIEKSKMLPVGRRASPQCDLGRMEGAYLESRSSTASGSTEMMHVFISESGDAIRPGSTGRAVPGYDATVLDADGNPMAEGEGRLAVKGPTGCRYLDDPRQKNYVERGWNLTGDTYRKDADGYFWYVARSDDMIVSSRLQYRRAGGGKCAARPPRRRGMRGDRRPLPRARPEGEGVHRRGGQCDTERGLDFRTQEFREGNNCAIQIPARNRVCRGTTEDSDGKIEKGGVEESWLRNGDRRISIQSNDCADSIS
jgi:2-aminobenzoate-CoA ligase